jgi:hypothetical protein
MNGPRRLPEAEITINGTILSHTQASTLRTALQFARKDLQDAPHDMLTAGLLSNVDRLLELIDDTPVTL